MEFTDFRDMLRSFADEPSNVDVRIGRVVAQIREDLIDITLTYSNDENRELRVTENGVESGARAWLLTRVARLPQLAERIIATTAVTPEVAAQSPFVVPEGVLTPDLSATLGSAEQIDADDAVLALTDRASSPLPGATSVLYITSDAGEGKTTIINAAARAQAKRYKERLVSSLIVPIPLSGRAFLTFDDAVIAALVNKLRFNYLYFDAFLRLVKMGAIVPAFDGYEEMLVEGSKGEAISALGNLVQTLDSSGTVYVAARKAFFEYISFKTQARLLDAIGDRSVSFSRLAIERWNQAQFCRYGHLRGAAAPEEVYDAVAARLKADHPLLTRAVLVRRLFDVAAASKDRVELVAQLGRAPQDYFYTFIDAIVKREANEKWLAVVAGDVAHPLLTVPQHHQLLALIAQEMWQTATTSLRFDVLDAIVDLFAEGLGKRGAAVRQIKERLKQHSLLAMDVSRGQALAFDHQDFQDFYLGESLGALLAKLSSAELQAFMSVNLVPAATAEQAIQHAIREGVDFSKVLDVIVAINETEAGFTFCKENCGNLGIRAAELIKSPGTPIRLRKLFVSANGLHGRSLKHVRLESCQFQPTATNMSSFGDVEFIGCEFERIEIQGVSDLVGCTFEGCRFDSLVIPPDEELAFDPAVIAKELVRAGAHIVDGHLIAARQSEPDERFKLLERFLRGFARKTYFDEDLIRIKLGKNQTSSFFADVLPPLLTRRILEDVQWRGRGVQKRFKLAVSMSQIDRALEHSRGDFDAFLRIFQ